MPGRGSKIPHATQRGQNPHKQTASFLTSSTRYSPEITTLHLRGREAGPSPHPLARSQSLQGPHLLDTQGRRTPGVGAPMQLKTQTHVFYVLCVCACVNCVLCVRVCSVVCVHVCTVCVLCCECVYCVCGVCVLCVVCMHVCMCVFVYCVCCV